MYNFEYEISGTKNVNRVLPDGVCCYYHYVENGNLSIHGQFSDASFFCPIKFEQKVIKNGGKIEKSNRLFNKKQNRMDNNNKNFEKSSIGDSSVKASLEEVETEIKEILADLSENELENTYSKIVLTSKNTIPEQEKDTFSAVLANHLSNRMNKEFLSKIKQKLLQIKNNLTSGEIKASSFTLPTCKPDAKGSTITISSTNYHPGILTITIEIIIVGISCSYPLTFPLSGNKFSSEDITHSLSEFSEGRTFLKGLTTSTETFTPGQ